MAANRYDNAVNYEYVDQYVPIPFQELVTLGKYYGEQIRLAEEDFTEYIKNANEFTSLISKDVDTYNETAFNKQVKKHIEQIATNPSIMKDAAWRSSLRSAINSVNYGLLNKLKSSAESAKVYDAAVKRLALEGKMPPGWEPNYFDTYDTAESGVFNATPLPYERMTERIKPYLDNLKDSYLYTKGGYDYTGVDEQTIATQLNAYRSDILRNPSNQRDIERYVLAGMAEEDAVALVLTQANVAGLEFARKNRTINPVYAIREKAKLAAGHSGVNSNRSFWFTQSMTADGKIRADNMAAAYLQQMYPEKYKLWGNDIEIGSLPNATAAQKEAKAAAEKEIKAFREGEASDANNRKRIFESGMGKKIISNNQITDGDAVNGTNLLLPELNALLGGDYNNNIVNQIRGIGDKHKQGDREITGPTNIELAPLTVSRIVGADVVQNGILNRLNSAIQDGRLGKIKVSGSGGFIALPNSNNSLNYGINNIELTEDAIVSSGIFYNKKQSDEEHRKAIQAAMKSIGAYPYTDEIPVSTSVTERESPSTYGDETKYSATTTTHSRRIITKYSLPVMYPLPSTGGGASAEMLNSDMAMKQHSQDQVGKQQSYNWILSNLYGTTE